jgi:hypothetical protein
MSIPALNVKLLHGLHPSQPVTELQRKKSLLQEYSNHTCKTRNSPVRIRSSDLTLIADGTVIAIS